MLTFLQRPIRVLAITTAAAVLFPTGVLAANYKIDPGHSFVQFRIKHLGYSWLIGRFNDVQGTMTWDEATPEASVIAVSVDPNSVDTNHAKRDKHLRSEDFLNISKHPAASFKSTGYSGSADAGTLSGELSIHGVTKTVSFPVTRIGQGDDPWGGYRVGFEGKLDITRADYDMTYNLGPQSAAMTLELYVEAIREK
ncbi:MAG: YceI family protein [Pseudomonadota bacterium]